MAYTLRNRIERLIRALPPPVSPGDEARARIEGMTTAERVARLDELVAKARAGDGPEVGQSHGSPGVAAALLGHLEAELARAAEERDL